jgi:pyroglutamyl-peptidase
MPCALVTAFEPFGGESINSSLEAVRRLPASVAALDVTTARLPTSFRRSLTVLEEAITRVQPDIVLCVGQAGDRSALCVERVAINLQDARLADNDGYAPDGVPVVARAPAAYFASFPVKAAVAALKQAGLPAEVSDSAGTFVCNHVFYGLMHRVATAGSPRVAGLLHVPRLTHQLQPPESRGGVMAVEDVVRAIVIVLETMAREL